MLHPRGIDSHPSEFTLFIDRVDGRTEGVRIGERAKRDRDHIRLAIECVPDRRSAARAEVKAADPTLVARPLPHRGLARRDDVGGGEASLRGECAAAAPLARQAVTD